MTIVVLKKFARATKEDYFGKTLHAEAQFVNSRSAQGPE